MQLKHRQFITSSFLTMMTMISGFTQAVELDSSFSMDGKVMTDLGSYDDRGVSSKIQGDGKIIVAGWTSYNGSTHDIALARYETNGELDMTFGFDGIVVTKLGNMNSRANFVTIQEDDKIIIVAEGWLEGFGNTVVLVRYNPDGTLDNTFDSDGKVFTVVGEGISMGLSLAIQSDVKLVVVGYATHEAKYSIALLRYYSNGSLDPTFGKGGIVPLNYGASNYFAGNIGFQKSGKIIVSSGRHGNVALTRFLSNGVVDNTFASDGIVITENACACDYSMVIQRDDKIVVIGESYGDIALFRYNADGSQDITFGDDGKVTTDIGKYQRGQAAFIQVDGKIIVAGSSYLNGNSYSDFALLRYNPDGSLDNTFDFDGIVTTEFSNYNDEANSIELQKDGKIVLTGVTSDTAGYDFGIARYNTTGLIPIHNEVKIYPNPTFGEIIIEGVDLNRLMDEKKLWLFDVLGKEIKRFEIYQNSIDISSLPSGMYFLKYDEQIEKIIKVQS